MNRMPQAGDNDGPRRPVLYREEQSFRQWWVWTPVLGLAALTWWTLFQQIALDRPVGNNPAPDWAVWLLWVAIGLAFPVFFASLRMVTEVTEAEVIIRYRPLSTRTIPMAQIERARVREYNPLREYGGWGVRGWSHDNMAYNVSGNTGVELLLTRGQRVLIGSQRANELAQIIETQRLSAVRPGK